MDKLDAREDHLRALLEEQREVNRATLARLDTLITAVLRDREGGREA